MGGGGGWYKVVERSVKSLDVPRGVFLWKYFSGHESSMAKVNEAFAACERKRKKEIEAIFPIAQ